MIDLLQASSTPKRGVVLILVLTLGLALLAVVGKPAAAIGPGGGVVTRPTRWVPDLIDAEMGYRNWGNVAYHFAWNISDNPASVSSYDNVAGHSLELGFKDTGFAACRTTQAINGSAGLPAAVYRGVDYTEDTGDAVFFVGDMHLVRDDVIANPGKLYSGWWTCQSSTGDFNPGPASVFQAQIGSTDRPPSSASVAQLNIVPHENVGRSFPPGRAPDTSSYTRMKTPWTVRGNFERSDATTDGFWGAFDATATRVTGTANQGNGFIRLTPTAGAPDPRYQQYTQAKNEVAQQSGDPFQRMNIGINTGFQYDGAFRCRRAYNAAACPVQIRVYGYPVSQPLSARSFDVSIANDDQWYYVLNDTTAAGGATANFWLQIRPLNRNVIDIDSQYVSSDY